MLSDTHMSLYNKSEESKMIRRNLHKIAILPLVLVPTILFGCKAKPVYGEETTYRDVLLKDAYDYFTKFERFVEIYDRSDIEITRSFIFVNGAIAFNINHRIDSSLHGEYFIRYDIVDYEAYWLEMPDPNARYQEDILYGIRCSDKAYEPLVWYKNEICLLSVFIKEETRSVFSRSDFDRIKFMMENELNDFSFMDTPFVETAK